MHQPGHAFPPHRPIRGCVCTCTAIRVLVSPSQTNQRMCLPLQTNQGICFSLTDQSRVVFAPADQPGHLFLPHRPIRGCVCTGRPTREHVLLYGPVWGRLRALQCASLFLWINDMCAGHGINHRAYSSVPDKSEVLLATRQQIFPPRTNQMSWALLLLSWLFCSVHV